MLSRIKAGPEILMGRARTYTTRREHCWHCAEMTVQVFELNDHFIKPAYSWRCEACQHLVETGRIRPEVVEPTYAPRRPRALAPAAPVARKPRSF